MSKICYYVSGHGFGHATRAAQVASALLQTPGTSLTICTKAPRHLFPDSDRLDFRVREVDSKLVQPLAYEIDVEGSFTDLDRFLGPDDGQSWLDEEITYLNQSSFDLVLTDAPWIVGLLKDKTWRNPPMVIISNFTFDLIFQDLLTYLPETFPAAKRQEYQRKVQFIKEAYKSFDYLIRLPGPIDFPFLQDGRCGTKVLDAPLIYRPPRSPRSQVLESLGIPQSFHNSKILLIQFGGHASAAASSTPPTLPDDWICLTSTASTDNRFFTFPSDFYLPDLINASDLVLGKIGYGTVSEGIGMAKPLLYVRREMFAEEPYLLKYMNQEGLCIEIGQVDFEAGQWRESIDRIMQQEKHLLASGRLFGMKDGSAELAKMIESIAKE